MGPTVMNELYNTHELLIRKNSVAMTIEQPLREAAKTEKMFLDWQ